MNITTNIKTVNNVKLMNNKKMSLYQTIMLITICRISTIYIYLPILKAPPNNQDAWLVSIISMFYIFVICFPLLYLGNKYDKYNLIEIIEKIFGKILGKSIGVLYAGFMVFICITLSCHTLQFIGVAIMPETPYSAILIFLLLACAYIVYKGIEVIGQVSEIFALFICLVIVLFTLFTIKDIDFKIFLPILKDSTLSDVNKGALNIALRFYDILIITMLIPKLNEKNDMNKMFFSSVVIYTIFATAMTISAQGILGVEQAKHAKFPYYLYSRQIDLFDFIQRIESITVIGWFVTVFIKFSAYLYSATDALKEIFNTKTHKNFIIPLIILIYFVVMKTNITNSVIFSKILSYKVFPYISAIFIFILPMLLLITDILKERINNYIKK